MRRRIAVLAVFALAGCANPASEPGAIVVPIAPDLALAIPSPADLGHRVEAVQLVVAQHDDRTAAFEGRISAAPDHFDLVCVDSLGRKSMSIHWTPGHIQAEKAPWVPQDLQPENMLADIVMVYWPAPVVSRALAASGGTMAIDSRVRSIRVHEAEAIHIDFLGDDPWNGRATYRNLGWNYTLDIRSRVIGP
jgi:hypothetical protein